MSAESDYLQGIIDRKVEFMTSPVYAPGRVGGQLDFGIEISIVEASQMHMEFLPSGQFSGSLSPGQKSYIRVSSSALRDTSGGIRWTPGGPRPLTVHTGLRFPDPGIGASRRWNAYPPAGANWIDAQPWSPALGMDIRSIDISLVPFGGRPPIQADGQIHLLVTGADGRTATASAIRLDQHIMQLVGYGAPMDRMDYSSIWVLSFYLYMRPPL